MLNLEKDDGHGQPEQALPRQQSLRLEPVQVYPAILINSALLGDKSKYRLLPRGRSKLGLFTRPTPLKLKVWACDLLMQFALGLRVEKKFADFARTVGDRP